MDENFRYKTSNFSLHYVLRQIDSGRMNINPDFKDLKSWNVREKSLFIESLLLGIPTQTIWCEESAAGDYIVIEGSERLIAILDFVRDKFALNHLKIRKEYFGHRFSSLPYHEKISLEDRYPFNFTIINYDTPYYLKYEFFRRLLNDIGNSNDQAARNFAWENSFAFLQNLKNECEGLINFARRDSRWRNIKTQTGQREIDEFFLYLLMIFAILEGNLFEEAYLDETISIADLLDWTMSHFDEYKKGRRLAQNAIIQALLEINNYLGESPEVILTRTLRGFSLSSDEIGLPEFYLMFVRACSGKLSSRIDWRNVKPLKFVNSSSAKNLISFVFEARDAKNTNA